MGTNIIRRLAQLTGLFPNILYVFSPIQKLRFYLVPRSWPFFTLPTGRLVEKKAFFSPASGEVLFVDAFCCVCLRLKSALGWAHNEGSRTPKAHNEDVL